MNVRLQQLATVSYHVVLTFRRYLLHDLFHLDRPTYPSSLVTMSTHMLMERIVELCAEGKPKMKAQMTGAFIRVQALGAEGHPKRRQGSPHVT